MRFSPVRGVNLIPDTICKSRSCRQILSRLRADLRENPTKQWASRDALIQSAGSISNNARYHSNANIALGPILKMNIPGQIRISNALNSDGYSTGNAPPSGNNKCYILIPQVLGQYCCTHSNQILEISDKNWRSSFDLKKKMVDQWQMMDSSASDKPHWLCGQRSSKLTDGRTMMDNSTSDKFRFINSRAKDCTQLYRWTRKHIMKFSSSPILIFHRFPTLETCYRELYAVHQSNWPQSLCRPGRWHH